MEIIEYPIAINSYETRICDFKVPRPCKLSIIDIIDGESLEFFAFHADYTRVRLNLDRHLINVTDSGEDIVLHEKFSVKVKNREPYPIKATVRIIIE